jgi:butyrate kinase
LIASEVQTVVRSHGGIQGVIHSVFFGASPAHFQLRELSTGELVKCVYSSRKQYDELANVLKQQNVVIHVYGTISTDCVNRQIEEMRVEKIVLADSFSKEDFDRFIGCAPGILGDQGLQDFIDYVRGRAN